MGLKDCGGAVTFGRMRNNSNATPDTRINQNRTSYFPTGTNSVTQDMPLDNHNSTGNGYFSAVTSQEAKNISDVMSNESQAELLRQVHNRKDLTKAERMMQKAGIKAGFRFDKDGNLVF